MQHYNAEMHEDQQTCIKTTHWDSIQHYGQLELFCGDRLIEL